MVEAVWIDKDRYIIEEEDYGFELCRFTLGDGLDSLTDDQKREFANQVKNLAISFREKIEG